MMKTLRGRLGLALGVTALASVLVTALVSVGLLRGFAERQTIEELRRVARAVAGDPQEQDVGQLDLALLRRALRSRGDELAVVLPDGTILADSVVAQTIAAAVQIPQEGGEAVGTVRVGGEDHVYVASPAGARTPFRPLRQRYVVMARPLRVARDLLPPMVARIALAGLGAVLLAVAASSWLAGRLVRPVKDLSVAASRIARGHLDQKVEVVSSDEFGQLAGTFNEMSTALTEAQRREREFLASVSHELRTPITAIKGYAEALQEGALTDEAARGEALAIIQDESDRLERMVRDVMDLARLGARNFQLDLREADLAVTLADAMRAHGAQAEDAGVTLSEDIATPMTATTDPDRVRQVVSNLIENALRVSGEESEVRVTGSMDGTDAVIEIADHGPGIGADDLPHVFERSYLWRSVKGSQPVGTGLGLAIVRELVGALGGTISVGSEVGRGTTFRLRIPITPTIDA